ncbi:MAG TPA: hypothetical protein VK506_05710 [Conexibacter sp.]|nr:hypothetical protein [Conexibacter sp.]
MALLLALLLCAAFAAAYLAAPAAATDNDPCGRDPVVIPGWPEAAHPCPLTWPLAPNNWVPVYQAPVPNPYGQAPPNPAGWLRGTTGKYFFCQQLWTAAMYYHPRGWRNNWWALTLDDDGRRGWVPEVFFKGGDDDEPDYGLPQCGSGQLPPGPKPVPPPPGQVPPSPLPPDPEPALPAACDPTDSVRDLRLRAGLSRVRSGPTRGVLVARYGRTLQVRGKLLGRDGSPLQGASVCVAAREPGAGASSSASHDTVVTDARGRFSYALKPGPSRRVWLVHRSGQGVAADSVIVRVRAKLRLRVSKRSARTGQSVDFIGRAIGRPLRQRLLVELQARRGPGWQTFATTRADRGGEFRYRYRFTRTVGTFTYQIRARVPGQPGYPYAAGGSGAVSVRVTG